MAGASAKKSAAAKAQIAAFYRPFLLIANGLYVALRYYYFREAARWRGWWADGLPLAAIAALQWYAYAGILEKAALAAQKKTKGDLVGGASLDLLAVTLAVQYGAVLWTPKLYYALWLMPVWGIYSLYATFLGGGSKKNNNSNSAAYEQQKQSTADTDADSGKRQKRAEKRRQKWS